VTVAYDMATWCEYSWLQTPPHDSFMNTEIKIPVIKFRPMHNFARKYGMAA
jgi:hypothetical protein